MGILCRRELFLNCFAASPTRTLASLLFYYIGTGPALCDLKKSGRSIGHVAMIPFVCLPYTRAAYKNSLTYLGICPWEKVSTGIYMSVTPYHETIQGGDDDVSHPLGSIVLVPGCNKPVKLTVFAW